MIAEMPASGAVVVFGAVEGLLDEAVLRRLIAHVGGLPGAIYGKAGKAALLRRLESYNRAAVHSPWVVLVDLDQDAECAPPFRSAVLPQPASGMCFRIAVHEVEAWLFADRERLARFLAVPISAIPSNPETVGTPKDTMAQLALRSRRREIREDMAPRPSSGRRVGPAYTSRLIQFVSDESQGWQPEAAAISCGSLARGLGCLRQLVAGGAHTAANK